MCIAMALFSARVSSFLRTRKTLTAAFSSIEQESAEMGLAVNEGQDAITTNNDVSLEIKRRVTLANMCYFGLNRQLSSRDEKAKRTTAYALERPG